MTEKKGQGRGPRRDEPSEPSIATELKAQRDAFLHTFFKRGAELTEEMMRENRRLREQMGVLEEENASLKMQLASDQAIRDLLTKITDLEREKDRLLSAFHEQEAITSRFSSKFAEIENELENFANLYVASFQLHASMKFSLVLRNLKELLVQLVGARSVAIFFADEAGKNLLAIASEGIDMADIPPIPVKEGGTSGVHAVVERSFLTGLTHVAEGEAPPKPAACIPLRLEDRIVGAIVVYDLLPQKMHFVTVDHELFKLLRAHAAGLVVAAWQWAKGGQRVPSAEALRDAGG
jgi:hypothetical protein